MFTVYGPCLHLKTQLENIILTHFLWQQASVREPKQWLFMTKANLFVEFVSVNYSVGAIQRADPGSFSKHTITQNKTYNIPPDQLFFLNKSDPQISLHVQGSPTDPKPCCGL